MAESQQSGSAEGSSVLQARDAQVLRTIKEQKESGNALFLEGQFSKAMRKYHNAKIYLALFRETPFAGVSMQEERTTHISNLPLSAQKEIQLITVSVANNLAACALKLLNWESAVKHASDVLELEPENQKANYRKGYALLNLNKLDDAIHFLKKAQKLSPNDSAVRKQLASACQRIKEYRTEEKARFKRLF